MYIRNNYYQESEEMLHNPLPDTDITSTMDPKTIIRKAKRQITNTKRVFSPKKKAMFEQLARKADLLAYTQALDFTAISTDERGIISMTGECLLFSNTSSESWNETKQTFLDLLKYADDIIITPESRKQGIRLIYNMYDETVAPS